MTGIWEASLTERHVAIDVDELLALNKAVVFTHRERIPYCPSCKRKVGRPSQPGVPDRTGYFPPKTVTLLGTPNFKPVHFYIELKAPGGKHRAMQDVVIERAQNDEVIAFFCDSREKMISEFLERGIQLKVL